MIDKRLKVSDLTVEELENVLFNGVKGALASHYRGLVNAYFQRYDRDFEALLDGLDQVIRLLKSNQVDGDEKEVLSQMLQHY